MVFGLPKKALMIMHPPPAGEAASFNYALQNYLGGFKAVNQLMCEGARGRPPATCFRTEGVRAARGACGKRPNRKKKNAKGTHFAFDLHNKIQRKVLWDSRLEVGIQGWDIRLVQ